MLDLVMGHQTSATYPSIKDLVTLSHLKTHGGTPHTPESCKIELREISDYMENFIANVVDDRVGTVNRKGKHHFSIIGTPLIPITSLANIVPPVLHITLGVVLKLFEMILTEVRKLDCNRITEVQKEIEKEWEAGSNELKEKENVMYKLCDKLLDLMNFKERFEAKFDNDISELDKVAKICSGRNKKQKIQPCSGFLCLASQFDDKLEWVQCDQCEDWFHMMCEGIPGCEYPQVELMARYICSKCRELDEHSILEDIACKIESLNKEVKSLEISINELTVECEKLRQDFEGNSMGDLECRLLRILDDISVKRQAYHGNVFVGNHCKVILAKD